MTDPLEQIVDMSIDWLSILAEPVLKLVESFKSGTVQDQEDAQLELQRAIVDKQAEDKFNEPKLPASTVG